MTVLHTVGIDPGLVHTGLVSIRLDTELQQLVSTSTLIDGPDAMAARQQVDRLRKLNKPHELHVFVEKYRPRAHYGTDERMVQLERDLRRLLPKAVLVNNTGINKVVTQDLMVLLQLWQFALPTHHQDLRSAARIAILGMLRDRGMNGLLTKYVESQVLHA